MAVLPVFIDFSTWASQIRNDYPSIYVPVYKAGQPWQEWAALLISSNDLANVPRPTSLSFPSESSWKDWAAYFINGVYNIN